MGRGIFSVAGPRVFHGKTLIFTILEACFAVARVKDGSGILLRRSAAVKDIANSLAEGNAQIKPLSFIKYNKFS